MGKPFKHQNLTYIGHMAIFYVPVAKLDEYLEADLHMFLVGNYGAYTRTVSPVRGFWRSKGSMKIFEDENYEYKVSYEGKDKIPPFVNFLAHLCGKMKEEAMYLEMGYRSYIVEPSSCTNTP